MCGRFTQHYTWAEVHAFLNVFGEPTTPRNLQPRYNIGPTSFIDVVTTRIRKRHQEAAADRPRLAAGHPARSHGRHRSHGVDLVFVELKHRRRSYPPNGAFLLFGPRARLQILGPNPARA